MVILSIEYILYVLYDYIYQKHTLYDTTTEKYTTKCKN